MVDVGQRSSDRATDMGSNLYKSPSRGLNAPRNSPYFWRNPDPLPIVTMCPNSSEAANVDKNALWTTHTSAWGEARWGRSSRLSGAAEARFFVWDLAGLPWCAALT